MIDLDRFIEVIDLAPPESYATTEIANALTSEIAWKPMRKPPPVVKATKGGFQTSGLPQPSDRAVCTVLDLIRLALDGFEVSLPASPKDPFVQNGPSRPGSMPRRSSIPVTDGRCHTFTMKVG